MTITDIKTLAKALFKGREQEIEKNQNFCLNLGRIEARLDTGRRLFLENKYGKPSANITQESSWRNARGRFLLKPQEEPNPHILITGMSGYGKSTLCKLLIGEICRAGKKIMVFDVHNEHTDAIEHAGGKALNALHAGINIFELDGMTVADRINDLTSLFTQVFSLGNIQTALLANCLWYIYRKRGAPGKNAKIIPTAPIMLDLIDELVIFQKMAKNPVERQGLSSMRNKFLPLSIPTFNSDFVPISELKDSVLSFSLAKLKNKEVRAIYINEMLKRLYVSMKDNKREQGVRHYILIDEAQFLIGNGAMAEELIKRLIEEGRKYGVGLIVSTHSASALDKQIVANASTYISFYSREPEEVEYVAKLLGGGTKHMANTISMRMMELERHEALVMSGSLSAPILVKTPSAKEVRKDFHIVEEDWKQELREDLLSFAYKVVTDKMILEKFGANGQTVTNELLAEGKIHTMQWEDASGKEIWYMAYRGNLSIRHELYIRKISDRLKDMGVPNAITMTGTNKPDIIVFGRGYNVAVEYETGTKTDAETKEMLMRRSVAYQKTYMVVADDHYNRYVQAHSRDGVVFLKFSGIGIIAEDLKHLLPKDGSFPEPAGMNAGDGPA